MAINLFIKTAQDKGHFETGKVGILWFIGIFASPLVVGLYVATLPDKNQSSQLQTGSFRNNDSELELPPL